MDDLRDEVRAGNRGINERLDKMPTQELLLAYLARTDAELTTVKDDVAEIKADMAGFKKQIADARRWGIGALISVGGLIVAALGLARSIVG